LRDEHEKNRDHPLGVHVWYIHVILRPILLTGEEKLSTKDQESAKKYISKEARDKVPERL